MPGLARVTALACALAAIPAAATAAGNARAATACSTPAISGFAVHSLSVHGIECETGAIYVRHFIKHGSPPGWTCRSHLYGTRGTRLSCERGEHWLHATWTAH
jgi:hypothetical protein